MENIDKQIEETLNAAGIKLNETPNNDLDRYEEYHRRYGYFEDLGFTSNSRRIKTIGELKSIIQSLPNDARLYGADAEYGFTRIVLGQVATNPTTQETALVIFADPRDNGED